MDNFFTRFRNETILVAILFVQVIALATQVRVPSGEQDTSAGPRLIRVWAAGMFSPFQKLFVYGGSSVRGAWNNYVDLRNVRQKNQELQDQIDRIRLDQTRLEQDAAQARRLQSILQFKEQFIAKTMAAQVIATSGTDLARVIYVDRGTSNGVVAGMAVITPDGIVGKVNRADKNSSQVLLITDTLSGAGVLLERQRLNGVLKGNGSATPEIQNVMADEKIEIGDSVVTTGGDRVFPKGLKVGTVSSVAPDIDRDPFLSIKVKLSADLNRLEEVLIVTELGERAPAEPGEQGPIRAADMLAQRLPSAKKKPVENQDATSGGENPSKPPIVKPPENKPPPHDPTAKPQASAKPVSPSVGNPQERRERENPR